MAVVALFSACGLTTCGEGPSGPPNIVLITADTLRADHMGLYGYGRETTPAIDAWFSQGTVFERGYSTTSYTPASVVSILTGLYPHNHGVRYYLQWLDEDLETVQGRLGEAGYDTAGIVSNVVLSSDYMGLHEQFGHFDDYVTERERFRKMFERTAGPTTDAALTWLWSERDEEAPFFLWVHYMDPHGPYTPPEPKVREFSHDSPLPIDPARILRYQRYPGLTDGLEYIDLYDEEIAYFDHEVGRLLEALEDLPGFDNVLVFLSADHGETMMEHQGWFEHDYHAYEELVRVPLAVRGPGFDAARVDQPVTNLAIAPTIYDAVGLEPGYTFDAPPLTAATQPDLVFAESRLDLRLGKWRVVVSGDDKWMINEPYDETRDYIRWYFDLTEDPTEQTPRPWTLDDAPEPARALERFMNADPEEFDAPPTFRPGTKVTDPKLPPDALEEAEERLRALGYL